MDKECNSFSCDYAHKCSLASNAKVLTAKNVSRMHCGHTKIEVPVNTCM